jgi:hypothetical protein
VIEVVLDTSPVFRSQPLGVVALAPLEHWLAEQAIVHERDVANSAPTSMREVWPRVGAYWSSLWVKRLLTTDQPLLPGCL